MTSPSSSGRLGSHRFKWARFQERKAARSRSKGSVLTIAIFESCRIHSRSVLASQFTVNFED